MHLTVRTSNGISGCRNGLFTRTRRTVSDMACQRFHLITGILRLRIFDDKWRSITFRISNTIDQASKIFIHIFLDLRILRVRLLFSFRFCWIVPVLARQKGAAL